MTGIAAIADDDIIGRNRKALKHLAAFGPGQFEMGEAAAAQIIGRVEPPIRAYAARPRD